MTTQFLHIPANLVLVFTLSVAAETVLPFFRRDNSTVKIKKRFNSDNTQEYAAFPFWLRRRV